MVSPLNISKTFRICFQPIFSKVSEWATLMWVGQPYKILEEKYTFGPTILPQPKHVRSEHQLQPECHCLKGTRQRIISRIQGRKHFHFIYPTFSLRISISIHQIKNPLINHKCLINAREIQLKYIRERFPFEEYRRSHRSKDAEPNVEL